MSTYRLDKLFSPRSVAVVGASPRETSPGRAVLRNLASAGFEGSVSLVNPHYGEIEGIKAVKTHPGAATGTRSARDRGAPAVGPRHRRRRRRKRCGDRDHHHRGPWTWRRLARRCLREGGARQRPETRWPELSWRFVVSRQAQRQFRRPHAARR